MTKEEIQMIGFNMIAQVGSAKSYYMEAIEVSKDKKFEEAKEMIEEGNKLKAEAHKLHFDLIQNEVNGEDIIFSLILMHAEDQLLTTEVYQTLAEEIIELRNEIYNN